MNVPTSLAGTLTIVFLVAFGVFVYPWLLKRRGGFVVVALATALLAVLFYYFDVGSGTGPTTAAALAVVWALLPVATGLLVWHFQRKPMSGG